MLKAARAAGVANVLPRLGGNVKDHLTAGFKIVWGKVGLEEPK
jgi:hypothetical protein